MSMGVCVANKHILLPFQAFGRHKYLQSAFKPRHTIKINKKPREKRREKKELGQQNSFFFGLSPPTPPLPLSLFFEGNTKATLGHGLSKRGERGRALKRVTDIIIINIPFSSVQFQIQF